MHNSVIFSWGKQPPLFAELSLKTILITTCEEHKSEWDYMALNLTVVNVSHLFRQLHSSNCDLFAQFNLFIWVKNPARQTATPRPCDLTWSRHHVSASVKKPPSPSAAAVNFLFTPSVRRGAPGLVCMDSMSSVYTVAAKFHRPTLHSTLVALCYLNVISHVHFWLTKMEENCACVCVCVCVAVCVQSTLQGQT